MPLKGQPCAYALLRFFLVSWVRSWAVLTPSLSGDGVEWRQLCCGGDGWGWEAPPPVPGTEGWGANDEGAAWWDPYLLPDELDPALGIGDRLAFVASVVKEAVDWRPDLPVGSTGKGIMDGACASASPATAFRLAPSAPLATHPARPQAA